MSRITSKSLPELVSLQVMSQIAGGEYEPGMSLPNESNLASEYGVSRIVIREAIRMLNSKGMIETQQGRGTFVNPRNNWDKMDPQILTALLNAGHLGELAGDMIEVRKVLEMESARLAALRAIPQDIDRLGSLLQEMAESSKSDLEKYIEFEHQFHRLIWKMSNNQLLQHILGSLSHVFVQVKQLVYRDNWIDVDRDHRLIFLAIQRRDSAMAIKAMEADISRFEVEIQQVLEVGLQETLE